MSLSKVIITGATGFVGGHILRKLLLQGHECIAMVRKPDSALTAFLPPDCIVSGPLEDSIKNPGLFDNVSAVIHCAARVHQMRESAADPLAEYRRVNRDLTMSLVQAALNAGVKTFIYLSTIKVMGDIGKAGHVFNETDIPEPTDPYGQSKYEAEQELERIFKNQTTSRCVILRLPMVYGEGNKGNMLGLLAAASKKRYLPLKAATAKRSMVNVNNITDAVIRILSYKPAVQASYRTFFLTDSTDHSSAELYSAIFRAMNNRGAGLLYVPQCIFNTAALFSKKIKGIVSRLFGEYCCSSELFQKTYAWTPPYTLEQGVQKLVVWWEEKKRR